MRFGEPVRTEAMERAAREAARPGPRAILALRTRLGGSGSGLVAALALGVLPPLAAPAATFNVGSFAKATGTPTATQAIPHGLGETPKTLILWTMFNTNESFATSYHFAIGATDGTSSESASSASLDGDTRSDASRRIAFKVLTIVEWSQGLRAEADLQSWDATNFTLSWSTNDATPCVIHFIAIGGPEVSAKVKDWVQQSGSTGNQSINGIGFQPDLVIHMHCGAGFTTAPSGSGADASVGLGMMDRNGNQWHTQFYTVDNSNTSDTQRYQRTNDTIAGIHSDLMVKKEASYVSMDPDGFTIHWSIVDSAASRVFSLALKGINVQLGSFNKSVATPAAVQSVTGVGFRPRVVLLESFLGVAGTGVVGQSRYAIGASNQVTQGSSTCQDSDGLGTTSVDSIDKTSKVFMKVDNNTATIEAEAGLTSLDEDGFTLDWTTNDAVPTQILYLALGTSRRAWVLARNQDPEAGTPPGRRTRKAQAAHRSHHPRRVSALSARARGRSGDPTSRRPAAPAGTAARPANAASRGRAP